MTTEATTTPSLPRLGSPAPSFEAETTFGPLRLEDFKGSWLILFSHPADFTPVCTTEFIAFAEIAPELKKRKRRAARPQHRQHLLAHRLGAQHRGEDRGQDPVPDHRRPEQGGGDGVYGMIMPGESKTETSRCVFVIDDKGIVRAMLYYPLTTGRNMDEILRLVDALQTTDKHGVATPANWRPGDKVIVPPPKTAEGAEARVKAKGFECIDWYLCKKAL